MMIDGMPVYVVGDDDPRHQNMPPEGWHCDGNRIFVRQSVWPKVRLALLEATPENFNPPTQNEPHAGRRKDSP